MGLLDFITPGFGSLFGGLAGAAANIFGASQQSASSDAANRMNYALGSSNEVAQIGMNAQNIAAAQGINAQNIALQEAINNQNIASQLNFAQNDILWKTQDAARAGINPLAALGASETSFSNVVAPQASPLPPGVAPRNDARMVAPDLSRYYSSAGQDLSRALSALQSPEDRAFNQAQRYYALEKDQAQIDLTRAQINQINAAGNPP